MIFQIKTLSMKTIKYSINLIGFIISSIVLMLDSDAQTLAFPTAEGYGKYTIGGRGGKLYIVSNLNNSGAGSLREALEASGKRIVVFKVSGIIKLQSDINITNGDVSIFGQSAPDYGICIANYTVQLSASNIIIRYIRFRPGSYQTSEYDASWGRNNSNIILDHCSYSWGNDEQASFYDNTNFTMQYCIITESFYASTHPKGNHGFGGIWGGMGATFHHNLISNHTSRTPRFCGARYHLSTAATEKVDFRNNVIFNWGYNNVYGGESGNHNMVNNYYKPGPATSSGEVKYRIVEPSDSKSAGNPISKWYVTGNYVEGNTAVTSDNWNGGVQPADGSIALSELKLNAPLSGVNINTQSPTDAYTKVLASAGASLKRDAVDIRAVNAVKTGVTNYGGTFGANKGIIDNETQVGGYPDYASTTAPQDTDKDGMPDTWESTHGLSTSVADQNSDRDGDGYTNIEEYLGCLVGEFNTCTAPEEPATLTKQGAGSSNQTVVIGSAIVNFAYAWDNATTVTISGMPKGITVAINTTTKLVSISGTPTELGVFNFSITTVGGSPDSTRKGSITVNDVTTDVTSEALSHDWFVYPNPSQGGITIEKPYSEASVKVYNAIGQLVSHTPFHHKVELGTELPIGIYILYITEGDQSKTVRWIKE